MFDAWYLLKYTQLRRTAQRGRAGGRDNATEGVLLGVITTSGLCESESCEGYISGVWYPLFCITITYDQSSFGHSGQFKGETSP